MTPNQERCCENCYAEAFDGDANEYEVCKDHDCPCHTQNHSTMEGWTKDISLLTEIYEREGLKGISQYVAKERESAERRVRNEIAEEIYKIGWNLEPCEAFHEKQAIYYTCALIARKDNPDP